MDRHRLKPSGEEGLDTGDLHVVLGFDLFSRLENVPLAFDEAIVHG